MCVYKNNLKCKFVLICIIFSISSVFANPIYFISCRPAVNKPPLGPHTAYIYELDEQGNFNEVWTLGDDKLVNGVRVYEYDDAVIFGVGYPYLSGLQIHKMSNLHEEQIIVFDGTKFSGDYRYYERPNDIDYIKYYSRRNDNNKSVYYVREVYNINFSEEDIDKSNLSDSGNVRLAGPGPDNYGHDKDIARCTINKDGFLIVSIDNFNLEIEPVPDSIIKLNKTNAWTMYSSGPDFIVINSISLEPEILKKELLIYDFKDKEWYSLIINGPRTSLRLINGWLAGVITKYEGEVDKMKLADATSMLSEDIVIVNPSTRTIFEEHLGKDCEVLWIDDDNNVYYKIWHSLYKAKIENNCFINRQLILTEPFVYTIHWAFESVTVPVPVTSRPQLPGR